MKDNSDILNFMRQIMETNGIPMVTLTHPLDTSESINPSYLSSLFSKEVGMPLTQYVNQRRIQFSQGMLIGSDASIQSIARRCGFSDVQYFNRIFKKLVNTTPKLYRETYKLSNEITNLDY